MPTTVLATALPHSLADDAPFQLTVFLTHKLVGGALLSDFPAAADWADDAGRLHVRPDDVARPGRGRCRCASCPAPTPPSWAAVLPPTHAGRRLPDADAVRRDLAHQPRQPDERPRRRPAPRGDHGRTDAAARPRRRPRGGRTAARPWPNLDQGGPLRRLLDDAPGRDASGAPGRRAAAAGRADDDRAAHRARRDRPRARPRRRDPAAAAVPVGDRRPAVAGPGAARRPRGRPRVTASARRAGRAGPVRPTRSCS